jgi:hypothetical protein
MKWLVGFFALPLLLLFAALGHVLYLYTHKEFEPKDFALSTVFEVAQPDIPDSASKECALDALNQKFFYLGCGKQMTAYKSEDGRFVIKFFNPRKVIKEKCFSNFENMRHLCTLKWLANAYFNRKARLIKLAERYILAYRELKDESGILYLHVSHTSALSKHLSVVNKRGKLCEIDLTRTPFVLQKKVELASSRLKMLTQSQDLSAARLHLEQLYHLFQKRAQKGFTDRIQTLHNNYGFSQDRAIQIDLGRIEKDLMIQENPDQEMERIFSNLNAFFSGSYPVLAPLWAEIHAREKKFKNH